jgi:tetratricopeptide (TPR) repeat protein
MRYMPLLLLVCSFVIAQQAQSPDAELAAARALISQGRLDDAISRLTTLEQKMPSRPEIGRELGIAYYRKGDFLHAAPLLQEAFTRNPGDTDVAQLLGLAYYLSGRPADAIAPLERLHASDPQANVDAAYVLSLCYALNREFDKARSAFASLYGVPSDSAAAHVIFAAMLVRQALDPVAEQEAKAALALNPNIPLGHYVLGEVAMYRADYEKAVGEFQDEIRLNPAFAPARTRAADAASHLARFHDAEVESERSIWLDSTTSEPLIVLAKTLLNQGRDEQAERTLLRTLALDANSYTAHFLLGQVYRKLGKMEMADREFKLAAQIQQAQTKNLPR